jgi:hypothetical protein
MITSPNQQPTTYTTNGNTLGKQAIALIRWPFTNRLAAPIWLALRLVRPARRQAVAVQAAKEAKRA